MTPRRILLAGGLIVLAGLLAYYNCYAGALVLDDRASILDNPTIRHLWPIWDAFSPPPREGITVSGRPILNFSLALNWAVGGRSLWGYHAVNVLIHLLAGLTLFGIVRRTLARTMGEEKALWIAWAAALWWTVHPLQTESVTYIIQRAESLMGLFYLLTLYGFVRWCSRPREGVEGDGASTALRPRLRAGWAGLSFFSCLLGMGTKEVMVSAPLMVLLYDRTFVAGTFASAWRTRRRYYLALASTWIPLAWLVIRTGNRGETSGPGIGVSMVTYGLTQFPAMVKYLRLTLWPQPLVFDYGTEWVHQPWSVAPAAILVLALAGATIWALRRRPALGFAGVFFFAILAPTSLVPGGRQTMAEHRMYLALAPLAVLAAVGLARSRFFIPVAAAIALALMSATVARNRDYRSALALMSDTVAKEPNNRFARNNLGIALVAEGRVPEAVEQYRLALQLNPLSTETHNDLGVALSDLGRPQEAEAHYREAIRLRPGYAEAYSNLGEVLFRTGRIPEAEAAFRQALALGPRLAEAHLNLGNILAMTGRRPDAAAEYAEALRLNPDYPEAENNLGNLLFQEGRLSEARGHVEAALRLSPNYAEPHLNLANILASSGHLEEAVGEYRQALRLNPNGADAHADLAQVLRALGRIDEAADEAAEAQKLSDRPRPAPQ